MKDNGVSRRCVINGDIINNTEITTPYIHKKSENKKVNFKNITDRLLNSGKAYINEKKAEKDLPGMILFTSIIAVLAVALLFFTPAYDVYFGGEKIGCVPDKEYFETVYSNVNYDISNIAGSYYTLNESPSYVFRIVPKNMFTPLDRLTDNLMLMSDGISKGYTVYSDGEPLTSATTKSEIETALNNVKASYGGEEVTVLNSLEIKPVYLSSTHMFDNLTEVFSNKLKIQTCQTISYDEPIYHSTEEIATEELRLGIREVLQQGIDGTRHIVAKLTFINGNECTREILSTTETAAPVTEIVNVGTREVSGYGTGDFNLPFDGMVSSRFGSRWGRTHKGIDIAGKEGSPVEAADNGIVTKAETRYDYGNLILLDHNNGTQTLYAHLSSIDVEVGDVVEKGQVIGKVGNTGISTGPHLHFEVIVDGVPQNPENYIY